MNPLVWGPPFWFVLHTVSFNYPEHPTYSDKRTHYDFFYNIRNVLPCEMCRQHYRELLKQYPIEPFLDSRESIISWVILIHNQVNQRLGKEMMSRDAVLEKYNQTYTRQSFCKAHRASDETSDDELSIQTPHISYNSKERNQWYTSGWWIAMIIVIIVVLCLLYIVYALHRRQQSTSE